MHRVPQTGPWWPAVAAPVERGVRLQCARLGSRLHLHAGHCASRSALRQEQSRYSAFTTPARGCACALGLAVLTKPLNSSLRQFVDSLGYRPGLIFMFCHLDATISDRSAVLPPIAASGGFRVHLDWPAFTPAPIEIRLFGPVRLSAASGHRVG
jgi:hypothetical protein